VIQGQIDLSYPLLAITYGIKARPFANIAVAAGIKHVHHVKDQGAATFQHIFTCGEIRIRQRLPNTLGSFLTGFIVASYLYLQSVSEAEPRTVPGKPAKGFGRIVVHDIAAIDIGMEEV